MLRSVAFALSFLLSLALGCGGGTPGTGTGGNNGGGGNTVSTIELPIDAVCYQTRMDIDESCNKPLKRAAGTPLPIFKWKFEARACDTNTLLHQADTSDFGVFWNGFRVQFPKEGCINVLNTITLPLPNKPSAIWNGAKRIEDTATLDPHDPPSFILYTSGDW